MKALLVYPSEMSVYKGTRFEFKQTQECVAPLNVAVIAGSLLRAGHEVRCLDLQRADNDVKAVEDAVRGFRPELVGVTFKTPLYHEAKRIARQVRDLAPHTLLVGGGVHPSNFPRECLEETEFDVICLGEADYTIMDVANGVPYPQIEDLAWKDRAAGEIHVNHKLKRDGKHSDGYLTSEQLDDLPYPAYELFPIHEYDDVSRIFYEASPVAFIETSRGCLARCVFCSRGVFGVSWRYKSVNRVVDEMEHLLGLGFREIEIVDDSFTTDVKRAIAICEEIVRRGLEFPWCCRNGLRVSNVNREFFQIARRAGLHLVAFGFETGNKDVLVQMRKGATLERGREAAQWAADAGITLMGYFMFGLPGETVQSMNDTIDYACSLPLDFAKFDITIPLPGTELYAMWKDRMKTSNWLDYNFHTAARNLYDHPSLDWDVIEEHVRKAYRRFYARPGYLLRQGVRLARTRRLAVSARTALQMLRGPSEKRVSGMDLFHPTQPIEDRVSAER